MLAPSVFPPECWLGLHVEAGLASMTLAASTCRGARNGGKAAFRNCCCSVPPSPILGSRGSLIHDCAQCLMYVFYLLLNPIIRIYLRAKSWSPEQCLRQVWGWVPGILRPSWLLPSGGVVRPHGHGASKPRSYFMLLTSFFPL